MKNLDEKLTRAEHMTCTARRSEKVCWSIRTILMSPLLPAAEKIFQDFHVFFIHLSSEVKQCDSILFGTRTCWFLSTKSQVCVFALSVNIIRAPMMNSDKHLHSGIWHCHTGRNKQRVSIFKAAADSDKRGGNRMWWDCTSTVYIIYGRAWIKKHAHARTHTCDCSKVNWCCLTLVP